MNRLYLLLISIFTLNANAQEVTIGGMVKDAETEQPLDFCSLTIIKSTIGTITDATGKFKITVPNNITPAKLVASYLGYASDTIQVTTGKNNYVILLRPKQGTLNEVVVTGVSKGILIRENPVAIETVSRKQIEGTAENNVIDAIAKNAPGLQTVKTGPNVSKPFINGLGYNRVLTLYDGMRVETQQWGDEHGVPMDDYIIERAEVIKGPASLMYGSDAIAGVLSLFPAVPHEVDRVVHGKFLSEYQSNNGLIGNNLQLTYGDTHWSWAIRGSERIARNYTNPIDGRVYNTSFNMKNASAFVGYTSKTGYSLLNYTFYDNRQGIPDGSRDSLTRKFTYPIYESAGENVIQPLIDNIKNRPIVPNGVLNSYTLSPLSQHIQDYRLYSNNYYKIGQSDIKFLLGWEQNVRREFDHPTDPGQAGEYIVLNTLNYGLRCNAPSFSNIETSFGVNGMYQTNSNRNATDFPIPAYNLFDVGAYAYAKWSHDRWTIAAGIRNDHRNENGDEMYIKPNPATGFYEQVPLSDSTGSKKQFSTFRLHFQGITGSLGTTYQLGDNLSFKANIARGYRSPNITEIASNGLDPGAHIVYLGNLDFVPEFSLQEDMGMIGEFPNVFFDFSVFNNNIQNYIYESQKVDKNGNPVVIIPGNKTFQFLQTNAQLYGMNAVVNINPQNLKALHFNNAFSFVDGYNRNPKYRGEGTNGEYLPFIPPPRLLSSVSYDIHASKAVPAIIFKAEGDFNSSQNRYLGLYKTETATAAYALLNVSVYADINYSKKQVLQLQLTVNNVFNTAYQSHLSRLQYFEYYKFSPNDHYGIYNMGRNICVKAIMRF
jgi:iron complex outermembrane receptor protein